MKARLCLTVFLCEYLFLNETLNVESTLTTAVCRKDCEGESKIVFDNLKTFASSDMNDSE